MHHSSVSWEITLLYFFSWNCAWFGQKVPIKVQNFRLLTAHMNFHQMCTLIDSFCLKYIKCFAKNIQRSCVSLPWTLMQILKKNWSVVSKMTRTWWILTRALGSLKNFHFHWLLLCKVFNVWPKKVQLSFMTLKGDAKFEKKVTCGLENDMRNMTNFHQSTLTSQNWDFDGTL